jgi:hypothetical protein
MANVEETSAKTENQFHNYRSGTIPWYVRLIWVLFWCFAAYYIVTYVFPNLRVELFAN